MACRCVVIIGSLHDFAWPRPAFLGQVRRGRKNRHRLCAWFYTGDGSGSKSSISDAMAGCTPHRRLGLVGLTQLRSRRKIRLMASSSQPCLVATCKISEVIFAILSR